MTILFFWVGSAFAILGFAILFSELKERRRAIARKGKIVGFSTGKGFKANALYFHSVIEYRGFDQEIHFVESPVGSSHPIGFVGKEETVFVSRIDPAKVTVQSSMTFWIGFVPLSLGMFSLFIFFHTFQADFFSLAIAAIVSFGILYKGFKLYREKPETLSDWKSLKKKKLSTRTYSLNEKDKIAWVSPESLFVAMKLKRKANSIAALISAPLAVASFLLCSHFYTSTTELLSRADKVDGYVVELAHKFNDNGSMYTPIVEYTNPTSLQVLRFKHSVSSTHPSYLIGDKVSVLVDPLGEKPAQIDNGIWNYLVPMIAGIVGLFFMWLCYASAKQMFVQDRTHRFSEPVSRRPNRSA